MIVDVTVPGDCRINEKEVKVKKYQDLRREVSSKRKCMWYQLQLEPLEVYAKTLYAFSTNYKLIKIGGELQKAALLSTARILKKVLEL